METSYNKAELNLQELIWNRALFITHRFCYLKLHNTHPPDLVSLNNTMCSVSQFCRVTKNFFWSMCCRPQHGYDLKDQSSSKVQKLVLLQGGDFVWTFHGSAWKLSQEQNTERKRVNSIFWSDISMLMQGMSNNKNHFWRIAHSLWRQLFPWPTEENYSSYPVGICYNLNYPITPITV